MSAGGLLKLGDFGVSKVLSSTHHFAATAIGTPFYMSPEICQNKKYDAKVGLSRKHPPPPPLSFTLYVCDFVRDLPLCTVVIPRLQ